MKKHIEILIVICITFSSCTQKSPKNLTLLSKDWNYANTTFWKISNDSEIELLKPKDTVNTEFIARKVYTKEISKNLNVDKIVLIDSKNHHRILESDLYRKKINVFTESHVSLSYDFAKDGYSAYIIDTIGTDKKIEENQREAKNAVKYARENDLELCGTAYFGILNEDIPAFPIIKEITKDSALTVINIWRKKS